MLILFPTYSSYGYSPHTLSAYLTWIADLFKNDPSEVKKPVIISITGTPQAIEATIIYLRRWIAITLGSHAGLSPTIGVEINLSCPNIKGNDVPSGYDASSVTEYILAATRGQLAEEGGSCKLSIGLKLPPYTYQAQFRALIQALSLTSISSTSVINHPIAFLTSTNTLGSSFWLNEGEGGEMVKALPSIPGANGEDFDGTGGLSGESLHPISLGELIDLVAIHCCCCCILADIL